MATTAASAEPALIGAAVFTATGQYLGTVRAVAGAAFWVATATEPDGVRFSVDRIQLFAAGRVYLAA